LFLCFGFDFLDEGGADVGFPSFLVADDKASGVHVVFEVLVVADYGKDLVVFVCGEEEGGRSLFLFLLKEKT
jgi:hypothetical protein